MIDALMFYSAGVLLIGCVLILLHVATGDAPARSVEEQIERWPN